MPFLAEKRDISSHVCWRWMKSICHLEVFVCRWRLKAPSPAPGCKHLDLLAYTPVPRSLYESYYPQLQEVDQNPVYSMWCECKDFIGFCKVSSRIRTTVSRNSSNIRRVLLQPPHGKCGCEPRFKNVCPKTVENFRCLCTGENFGHEYFERWRIPKTNIANEKW